MGSLSTIKADNSITEFKNFNCQSVSVKTIYRAIDQGLIPGVARASLQTEETKIFSDGLIHIPQNLRERFDFRDEDVFKLIVSENKKITIKAIPHRKAGAVNGAM